MPPASTSSWEKEVLGAGSGGAGVLVVLVLVLVVAVLVLVALLVAGVVGVAGAVVVGRLPCRAFRVISASQVTAVTCIAWSHDKSAPSTYSRMGTIREPQRVLIAEVPDGGQGRCSLGRLPRSRRPHLTASTVDATGAVVAAVAVVGGCAVGVVGGVAWRCGCGRWLWWSAVRLGVGRGWRYRCGAGVKAVMVLVTP